MASILKPPADSLSGIAWKKGNSSMQGSHQVAQKLTTTILPLKLLKVTFCPSRFLSVKSGARLPTLEPIGIGVRVVNVWLAADVASLPAASLDIIVKL